MGFFSAGRGQGSTFYFELPLYSAAYLKVDSVQASRALLPLQTRVAVPPMAGRRAAILPGDLHTEEGGDSSEANHVAVEANLFRATSENLFSGPASVLSGSRENSMVDHSLRQRSIQRENSSRQLVSTHLGMLVCDQCLR